MSKFADKTGQEWRLEVTVADLKPLREEYQIDLKDTLDKRMESFDPWIRDPEKLVVLLWHFCQEEAAERKVKPEQFGKLMSGGPLRAAALAFVEAVFDFSHGPEMGKEMAENLRAELEGVDQSGTALVAKAFSLVRSKRSAGNSAGLSESIPVPSV